MKMTNRCSPPSSSVSLWDLPESLCFIRAKWGFTLLSVCWLMKSQMQLLRSKRKATDQPLAFLIEHLCASGIICQNLAVSWASYYLNNNAFFPQLCTKGWGDVTIAALKNWFISMSSDDIWRGRSVTNRTALFLSLLGHHKKTRHMYVLMGIIKCN